MSNNEDCSHTRSSTVSFDSAQSVSIIAPIQDQNDAVIPNSIATKDSVKSKNPNENDGEANFSRDVEEILVQVINEEVSTELDVSLNPNPNATLDDSESSAPEARILIEDNVATEAPVQSVQPRIYDPNRTTRNFPFNSSVQRSFAIKAHRCYRAFCGQTNSDMDLNMAPSLAASRMQQGPPPLSGAPPSYSVVMHQHSDHWIIAERRPLCVQPSPTFIAPIPPPTYTEVQGFQVERPMMVASIDQMVWGPEPLAVICPHCSHVIMTSVESHRSNLTHFSALVLCLFGCWPCCLLPYCMESCKNTYHRCPTCDQYLGMYRPW